MDGSVKMRGALRLSKEEIMRKVFISVFLSTAVFVSMLVVAEPARAQQLKEVTISEAGRLFLYIPLYYAVERGYFEKEGLKVNVFSAGRRDLAMKAVIAGQSFGSLHDPVEAALAHSRGARVKVIAVVVDAAAHWLTGTPDITYDQDTWKGKTIALATPPNTQHSFFVRELEKGGWKHVGGNLYQRGNDAAPANLLKLQYGTWGTDLAAIMAGRADFALMLEPGVSTAMLKKGMHIIKDYPGEVGSFLFSTINVSDETIKNDAATVQKFLNALTRAYRDAYRDLNDLAKVAEKWFPQADPDVVKQATERMIKAKSFGRDATFTKESFQKNLEYLAIGQPDHAALKVKFEDVADTSFAKRAAEMVQ